MTAAEHDTTVVQLHKNLPALLEVERAPTGLRAAVARATDRPLPTAQQIADSARWWLLRLLKLLPLLPLLGWRELRPTLRGVGRVVSAWTAWAAATERKEAAKLGEGNVAAKLGVSASKTATARGVISLALFAGWSGVWIWLWLAHLGWAVAGTLVALAVFDLIGRASHATAEATAVVLPTGPLVGGFPLSSLRAEIQGSFEGQGIEIAIQLPYPVEHGWTVEYHSRAAIEDEHLRQLERDLNIRRGGITQIVEKGQAARGSLHITLRDPLENILFSPEPATLSLYDLLPLGGIASGLEWGEQFLRTHFAAVGRSQSGKSSWFWQVIDVLRRCPEVELDAIDLTEGPVFSACRRAFRKRAFTEEDAHKILDDGVRLCMERNRELQRLAEADDTPDDFEEKWHPTAGHPQRTILIDEFALIAITKEQVSKEVSFECTLLGKVEFILRYGAKAAVTMGMASQGGTLTDWGTAVVRDMVMLKVMFACGRMDVLWMFGKDARDDGHRPDLLEPANGGDVRDAGKCFVQSATSKTAEPRRAYRLEQSEVRRRDRALGYRDTAQGEVLEAVEIPPVPAAVARVFDELGAARIPTTELIERLAGMGIVVTDQVISDAMKIRDERLSTRWRETPGGPQIRGYTREAVARKIRSFG